MLNGFCTVCCITKIGILSISTNEQKEAHGLHKLQLAAFSNAAREKKRGKVELSLKLNTCLSILA